MVQSDSAVATMPRMQLAVKVIAEVLGQETPSHVGVTATLGNYWGTCRRWVTVGRFVRDP